MCQEMKNEVKSYRMGENWLPENPVSFNFSVYL